MNTVSFHTLGCKLNFAETSTIARLFRDAGWKKVEFGDAADVTVINTCSVTAQADKECKTVVNRALHANPATFIAVIGCYAQLKPEAIASIKGVDLVLGANEKFNLLDHVNTLNKESTARMIACDITAVKEFHSSYSSNDRTRTFLKVQDGCDYQCSFCTIPQARGMSRSNSPEKVLEDIRLALGQGAQEIILTGVNLGDFGIIEGKRKHTFTDLVRQIDLMPETIRVRISSIDPNLLTEEIITMVAKSSKFTPHFHSPLQSGSNSILKKMRRRYLRELYAEKVDLIKTFMPHCCIGADVITGFPGETEDDFLNTFNFLHSMDVSYLHVFTYSERDNTIAADMQNAVPVHERRKRTQMLRSLSSKKLRKFYQENLGRTLHALMETENKDGMMHGYTENYVRIRLPYDAELINKLVPVLPESISDDFVMTATVAEHTFIQA